MNPTLLFVIISLFVQEPASTDAAIFLVRQNHFNILLINLVWLFATSVDTALGYWLGKLLQEHHPSGKFILWAKRHARRIEDLIGNKGTSVAAVALGYINVPYLNGFIFAWLRLPFWRMFFLILGGNALYWAMAWALNIGVRSVVDDWRLALGTVVVLGLVLSFGSKIALGRIAKRRGAESSARQD